MSITSNPFPLEESTDNQSASLVQSDSLSFQPKIRKNRRDRIYHSPHFPNRYLPQENLLSYWHSSIVAGNKDSTLQKNYHYHIDYKRFNKAYSVEQQILDKYGSYQFNRLNINVLESYYNNPTFTDRWTYRKLIKLINKFIRNKVSNGFGDMILGYIWCIEKGLEKRRWHLHLGVFWRYDVDCDRMLVYLKGYIEKLSVEFNCGKSKKVPEIRGWLIFDSIEVNIVNKGLGYDKKGIVKENKDKVDLVGIRDYSKRNKVRYDLMYFCKIEVKGEKEKNNRNKGRYLRHSDVYRDVKKGSRLFSCKCCNVDMDKEIRSVPLDFLEVSRFWMSRSMGLIYQVYPWYKKDGIVYREEWDKYKNEEEWAESMVKEIYLELERHRLGYI